LLRFARNDGNSVPIVIADYSQAQFCQPNPDLLPDFLYSGTNVSLNYPENQKVIIDYSSYTPGENRYPLFTLKEKEAWLACDAQLQFIRLTYNDFDNQLIEFLKQKPQTVIILYSPENNIDEQKAFIQRLALEEVSNQIVIHLHYNEKELDVFRIKSATDAGSFFLDRLADGIFLSCHCGLDPQSPDTINPLAITSCSFGILQATGRRISKTEYIACPSCGRTLFDLQTTLKKIKEATTHLKGLKIGVMGCIVNGPGEMADADYGYVGAGVGRISLYKGKECVKKNIPEAEAVEELLKLING
jgi:(E)-4-hydroxy-3-methylbut-2-enyl-diphosphate synthase